MTMPHGLGFTKITNISIVYFAPFFCVLRDSTIFGVLVTFTFVC